MKNTLLVLLPALINLIAAVGQAQPSYTEDFTTTTYQESGNNSLVWDTNAGELRLAPLAGSVISAVPVAGNSARGIDIAGQYAFVADGYAGVQVIDLAAPWAPVQVGSYNTAGYAYDVQVVGQYAYVASHSAGLQVLDVSDPTAPTLAGAVVTSGFALGLFVVGDRAYVGGGVAGLVVVDISDPTNPNQIWTVNTAGKAARNVFVAGNYAYLVDGDAGLVVLDITNPQTASPIALLDTPGYAYDVVVEGSYAYVADRDRGLLVVDISNPAAPVAVGSYDTFDIVYGVQVAGDHAYLANDVNGLLVLDVSNPASPVLEQLTDTPGHAYDVLVHGEYAYVADLGGGLQALAVTDRIAPITVSAGNAWFGTHFTVVDHLVFSATRNSGLMISDITDPAAPQTVSQFDTGADVWDVAVSGRRAYLASYQAGLQVVDVSDPAVPVLIGVVDTPGFAAKVTVDGDFAYVADEDSGLQIIDISDPTAPVIVGAHATVGEASHVVVSGDLAVVARTGSALDLLDISDPTAPVVLANFALPNAAIRVSISGQYLYVAGGTSGLNIIDISTPSAPVLVTTVSTGRPVWDVQVAGGIAYLAEDAGFREVVVRDPTAPSLSYAKAYAYTSYVRRVQVAGDYAYVGSSSGLRIEQVYQNDADLSSPLQMSKPIPIRPGPLNKIRVTTSGTGDVSWDVSGTDGQNWYSAPVGVWSQIYNDESFLRWSSWHKFVPGTMSAVSNLKIEWLYDYPLIEVVSDVPNDQGRQVSLAWARSGHDFVGDTAQVVQYAVYRQIDTGLGGKAEVAPDLNGASPALQQNAALMAAAGWHFLTTVPVLVEDQYAVVVPTLADSTAAAGAYATTFKVVGLTATPGVFYTSPPDSGSSVDNLAPSAPLNFAAAYQAGTVGLDWDDALESDVQFYRVYRGTDPAFLPGPGNLVREVAASAWTDSGPDSWSYFYKVAAVDFSGNEGPAAELSQASSVPGATAPLVLHDAFPNPFNPTTMIRYTVAEPGAVRLVICDVSGREVTTLVDQDVVAGEHSVQWQGQDRRGQPVASGVYFYRLTSRDGDLVKPMVLLK